MVDPPILGSGLEWLVDAFDCDPERLRSTQVLDALFERLIDELGLHPLGPAQLHAFPEPGGVTGILMLSESHLCAHTFPERGYASLDLYCCRPRVEWSWAEGLRTAWGSERVAVRRMERPAP